MSWKNILVFMLTTEQAIIGHTGDDPDAEFAERGHAAIKNPKLILLDQSMLIRLTPTNASPMLRDNRGGEPSCSQESAFGRASKC